MYQLSAPATYAPLSPMTPEQDADNLMTSEHGNPATYRLNDDGTLSLSLSLPPSAREGDIVAISATREESRHADGYGELVITEKALAQKLVTLTLQWHKEKEHSSDVYVIQSSLHGRHRTIKESALHEAYIDVGTLAEPKKQSLPLKSTLFTSLLGGLVGLLVKSEL